MKLGGRVRCQATAVLDGRTFRARIGYRSFGPEVLVRIAAIAVPEETSPAGADAARALARLLGANASNRINLPLVLEVQGREDDAVLADVEIQMPFAVNRRERRRRGPGAVSGRATADAAEQMVKKGHATRT